MNELKDLLSELLCEMQGLNEVEIKELRKEWIDKLIEVGNKKAIRVANLVGDIAIEQFKQVAQML